MALELPDDGPGSEGGEVDATLGIESIHRLHQRNGGHLHKILQGLTTMQEPARQLVCQPEVVRDHGVPGRVGERRPLRAFVRRSG